MMEANFKGRNYWDIERDVRIFELGLRVAFLWVESVGCRSSWYKGDKGREEKYYFCLFRKFVLVISGRVLRNSGKIGIKV